MKHLVLLGGGHAHVKVLAHLAERPLAGWDVHLITPYRRQMYSGMLPGWVAGHYPIESCAIVLHSLAARAAVVFHATACQAVNPERGAVRCADGSGLRFDALSIDTGPMPALQGLPGGAEHALPVRPIEQFVAAWPLLVDHIVSQCRRFDLVILGAGAAGIELAFAVQRRAVTEGWSHMFITVVGFDELPLPGAPQATRRHTARLLAQRGISWRGAHRANRMEAGAIHFEQGPPLTFDACVASTGAAAPAGPGAAGGCGTGRTGSTGSSCNATVRSCKAASTRGQAKRNSEAAHGIQGTLLQGCLGANTANRLACGPRSPAGDGLGGGSPGPRYGWSPVARIALRSAVV